MLQLKALNFSGIDKKSKKKSQVQRENSLHRITIHVGLLLPWISAFKQG